MKLGTSPHDFHENAAPATGAPRPAARARGAAAGISLRLRVNLLLTVLMALFALAVTRMIIEDTRSSIKEEIDAGTKVTVQMLSAMVFASQLTGAPRPFLRSFLERLGRVRANHIRLWDAATSSVVYESPPPTYKAGRDAPQWYAGLVVPKFSPVQIQLTGARIEVVPDPSRATLDAWDDLKHLLMLWGLFFVVVNALVFWCVSRWMRPMDRIQQALAAMEGGRLDVRLPDFPLADFRRIGVAFNRMTRALGEATAESRRLALAARQSSDAIVIHDLDARISFWNPAAERMFGYGAREILGQPIALLGAAAQHAEIDAQRRAVERRQSIDNVLTRRLRRDGSPIDVALSAAPLVDPDTDAVVGGIVSHRDVSQQLRAQAAEAELGASRELARLVSAKVEQERREIAQELHDELGQCVTAIRTIAESLVQLPGPCATEVRNGAKSIKDIAARIYEGMHAIARRLRPAELDTLGLAETLRGTIDAWAARNPGIAFNLQLHGGLQGLHDAVSTTVYRLVHEALTNVVRHSRASRATVRVTRASEASLLVMVEDDGHGQVGMASSSMGLGLLGMAERVEALGGTFAVEGRPGVGTTLRASIPLAGG